MRVKACERCGFDAEATVELLEPPDDPRAGQPFNTIDLCRDHERELLALLTPTYVHGEPAYRVDRYPARIQ